MRVTKRHSGNRRAHHALGDIRLSQCSNCQAQHERHRLCLSCGFYRGKKILEIKTKKKLVKIAEDDIKKIEHKHMELNDTKNISEAPKAKVMKKVQNKG